MISIRTGFGDSIEERAGGWVVDVGVEIGSVRSGKGIRVFSGGEFEFGCCLREGFG